MRALTTIRVPLCTQFLSTRKFCAFLIGFRCHVSSISNVITVEFLKMNLRTNLWSAGREEFKGRTILLRVGFGNFLGYEIFSPALGCVSSFFGQLCNSLCKRFFLSQTQDRCDLSRSLYVLFLTAYHTVYI